MKGDRAPLPIHTLLFATFPVLSLLASNIAELRIEDSVRPLATVVMLAAAAAGVLTFLLRDLRKAAVIASLAILIALSYGHVYTYLKGASIGVVLLGRHRFLLASLVCLLTLALWLVARYRGGLSKLTRILNAASAAAVVMPAAAIAVHLVRGPTDTTLDLTATDPGVRESTLLRLDELPDIYYIVPDMYVRSDVLQDLYHVDNSEFIRSLKESGFYVAEQSRSNYLWTHLSLASTLNLDYIPNLIPGWTQGSPIDATPLIQANRVRAKLESLGYSTVGFATGMGATEWFDADFVLTPDMTRVELLRQQGAFNDLEGMLVHNSILRVLVDLDAAKNMPVSRYIADRMRVSFVVRRELILAEFDNLASAAEIPGPKFVFAHILSPHQPYIFGPSGEQRDPNGPFTLSPTDDVSTEGEARLYGDQLLFITSKLEEVVSEILSRSDRPVIILIQADHGPGIGLDWAAPDPGPLLSRSAILNAYYLPSECRNELYSEISPVNSFRVIFNCLFGAQLPILEDATYFGYEEFIPIEDMLGR